MYKTENAYRALLDHVRHSDFGVLFKHTGHQAITADIINTLHVTQKVQEENFTTLYYPGLKSLNKLTL